MTALDLDATVARIQALIERNRTAQARQLLKPALTANPDDRRLLLLAAQADYLDDHSEGALVLVQQILASYPDYEAARHLLFDVQLDLKMYPAAEETILGLLKDWPEEAKYFGRYAQLMLRTMQRTKAAALAEAGLKLDAEDPECLAVRSMVELIEQPSGRASAGLQQLLVLRPESLRTLLIVVVALQDRGDYAGARRLAEELVRARPDNQSLVDLAKELGAITHWSMVPLWPMQRFGWRAVIGFWVASIIALNLTARFAPAIVRTMTAVVLVYVAYSWIWPRVIRHYVMRRP